MNNKKRILAIMLCVFTIVSMLIFPASADCSINNCEDRPFEFNIHSSSVYTEPQYKADTSACYAYVQRATYNGIYMLVSAYGCSASGANKENHTLNANGLSVTHVTFNVGEAHRIRSLIKECGHSNACLGFRTPVGGGNWITGLWSPDSCGNSSYAS